MLSELKEKLKGLVAENWVDITQKRGKLVTLYRQYDDGEHRDGLTSRQKTQLGIAAREVLDQFNINYMPMVVGKMAERLHVTGIEVSVEGDAGENDAQSFIDDCRKFSRFDELEKQVHKAVIRDGYTFVMLNYDEESGLVKWAHEEAWDDESKTGIVPVLAPDLETLAAVIKIWDTEHTTSGTNKRVNIYYPDRIEKYTTTEDSALNPYTEDTDTDETGVAPWIASKLGDGQAIGIPIYMFSNNKKKRFPLGCSELHNAVPLQDAANWTLVDFVMTGRLSAFPLRTAKGFVPDGDLAPGDWVVFGDDKDQADILAAMDAGVIAQASLVPFLEAITHIEDRMSVITRTPIPSTMGSSAQSGEALKERQTELIEKVQNAQVIFGNVWEDIAQMCIRLREVFGQSLTSKATGYKTRWQPAQIRNDLEIMQAAQIMRDAGYEREFLRLMGQLPYLGYDDAKITQLLDEKIEFEARKAGTFGIPGIGSRNGAFPFAG